MSVVMIAVEIFAVRLSLWLPLTASRSPLMRLLILCVTAIFTWATVTHTYGLEIFQKTNSKLEKRGTEL